ncbi:MAG: hypothetical protein HYT87_00370 [Nitrospirae bacterium]|nr:hypothetical protein [Nitrospirota bacterium]
MTKVSGNRPMDRLCRAAVFVLVAAMAAACAKRQTTASDGGTNGSASPRMGVAELETLMMRADDSIAEASKKGAEQYAPALLKEARESRRQCAAFKEMEDFRNAQSRCEQAVAIAKDATERSLRAEPAQSPKKQPDPPKKAQESKPKPKKK